MISPAMNWPEMREAPFDPIVLDGTIFWAEMFVYVDRMNWSSLVKLLILISNDA